MITNSRILVAGGDAADRETILQALNDELHVVAAQTIEDALAHAEDSVTWRHAGELRRIELDERVKRGDELGAFRLGSTVVMCFQPGSVELDGEVGQAVRFGERIGEMAD